MKYYNGQSTCDIGNPAYERSYTKKRKTIKGRVVAKVHGHTEDDYEDFVLYYEAEDTGDGWEVYIERPDFSRASDLLADITEALHEDGIQDVAKITWL